MRIALLEDNFDYGQLLVKWLQEETHSCEHFSCSQTFVKTLQRESFDLLILAWLAPKLRGVEVLQWVRDNLDWRIPILLVTIMDREDNLVEALDNGADDYMIKPVAKAKLVARVTALSRRASTVDTSKQTLKFEPFHFNQDGREVARSSNAITLTRKEFELSVSFFRNIGSILSRGHILQCVWGRSPDVNTRTVDTHISRLRTELGLSPDSGWRLSSIYQHGYRLERLSLANDYTTNTRSPLYEQNTVAAVD